MIDPQLAQFATPRQAEYLAAIEAEGSHRKAAKALGVNSRTIERALEALKRKAALRGYSPAHDCTHPVPEGQLLRGVSTYYGPDGEIKGQWVKSAADRERRFELLRDATLAAFEDCAGKSRAVKAPKRANRDLLAVYPFGDPHIGMYAWAAETGVDFDCDIAERNLTGAVDRLVDTAPATQTAVLLNLGDFYHSDTLENKTRRSGNVLDVDTRWGRVLEIGVKVMIRCIDRALEKHKKVIVRCNPGNHDEQTAVMLALALKLYYRNNKRVEIDDSPAYFWFHRFGQVLIGSTHGDTVKHPELPAVMAAECPEDWGQTHWRYWYTGHIHTEHLTEYRGCTVESFRTLAARDAWHAKMGYRAGRDMYIIVHDRNAGEIERHRVDVRTLEAAA